MNDHEPDNAADFFILGVFLVVVFYLLLLS